MTFPQPLRLGTRYTHSGNMFSRAFFIARGLPEGKKIVVFDTEREVSAFMKIYPFVSGSEARRVDSLVSLLGLVTAQDGCFVTTTALLDHPIDVGYLRGIHTKTLSRNMELSMDDLVNLLIEFEYTHSPHLSKPGTYRKDGDIVSIRSIADD